MSGVRLDLRDFDLRGLSSLEYILATVTRDNEKRRSVDEVRGRMAL